MHAYVLLLPFWAHRTPPATIRRLILQAATNMHHWKAIGSTSVASGTVISESGGGGERRKRASRRRAPRVGGWT